jgi:hypothetical protein
MGKRVIYWFKRIYSAGEFSALLSFNKWSVIPFNRLTSFFNFTTSFIANRRKIKPQTANKVYRDSN